MDENTISIENEEARHCAVVLRLKTGNTVGVLNKNGWICIAELSSINKKQCSGKIIEIKNYSPPKIKLHLIVSPPKNNARLECLVEKAVELQVWSVLFVKSKRCIRRNINLDRLKQIADAAAKQSAHPFPVHLQEYPSIHDILNTVEQKKAISFLLHCEPSLEKIKFNSEFLYEIQEQSFANIYTFIGPEGDWTKEEINTIQSKLKKVYEIDLGDTRLRTETAAILIAAAGKIINF